MARLYKRYIQVQIDDIILNPQLRCKFEITKNVGASGGTGNLQIYNLSSTTRGKIKRATSDTSQTSGSSISIIAGYEQQYEQIFSGEVLKIEHEWPEADIVTKIRAVDSFSSVNYTDVNKSYKAGVSANRVIKDLVTEMALDGYDISTIETELTNKTFDSSFIMSGKPHIILDNITKQIGATWAVQDSKLVIIKNGESINANTTIKLSEKTGLIDVPIVTEKGINIKALLNPRIKPGMTIKLISEEFDNADIYLQKVKYIGDNYGLDWYCICDGIQPNSVYI